MKKILIVEDDISLRNELKILLDNSGYNSFILETFENAESEIINSNSDLILLDINLPKMNGEILLKNIRKEINTPVIMVTSKNTEADEVLSLSYGADDFITKPYNPALLLLHIEAIFRRLSHVPNILTYENLSIIPEKGIIKNNSTEVYLSKNEMMIFKILILKRGTIVSREEIMSELWNSEEFVDDNTLTVNISRLRNKLKDAGYENIIETRKGQGYILLWN